MIPTEVVQLVRQATKTLAQAERTLAQVERYLASLTPVPQAAAPDARGRLY